MIGVSFCIFFSCSFVIWSYFVVLAFCPNNNEVHIYTLMQSKWEKLHVLQKVLCSNSWACNDSCQKQLYCNILMQT